MIENDAAITPSDLMTFLEHEVRNSATIITGDAASLRFTGRSTGDRLVDSARTCDSVAHRIEEEARSLAAFVSTLADIATKGAGSWELEPTLVQRVIPKLVARLSPGYSEREIVVHLPPNLPPVLASEPALEVVLKNLLLNAHKYSPASEPIRIAAWAQENVVVVVVHDNGRVTGYELERLFDMAYRSDSVQEGTEGSGIGLTECRSLLRLITDRYPPGYQRAAALRSV